MFNKYKNCFAIVFLILLSNFWLANRVSKPRKEVDGHWSATPQSGSISFGAEGDSYYEYLIKAFYQTSKLDKDAKELYDRSIDGAKKILVK